MEDVGSGGGGISAYGGPVYRQEVSCIQIFSLSPSQFLICRFHRLHGYDSFIDC